MHALDGQQPKLKTRDNQMTMSTDLAIAKKLLRQADRILTPEADKAKLVEAAKELRSLVGIMFGRGPDCIIPETIGTPLGVPIRIGAMMRDTDATLAKHGGSYDRG